MTFQMSEALRGLTALVGEAACWVALAYYTRERKVEWIFWLTALLFITASWKRWI